MIQPLLETRAKKCENFCWFFGVWEDKIIWFWDLLTFRYLVKPFGQFWLAFVSWLHDQTSFFFRISGEKKLLTKWLLIIVKIPRWTLYNIAISFELSVNELFLGEINFSSFLCSASKELQTLHLLTTNWQFCDKSWQIIEL